MPELYADLPLSQQPPDATAKQTDKQTNKKLFVLPRMLCG